MNEGAIVEPERLLRSPALSQEIRQQMQEYILRNHLQAGRCAASGELLDGNLWRGT